MDKTHIFRNDSVTFCKSSIMLL